MNKLLHDGILFNWNEKQDNVSITAKETLTHTNEITLPNAKNTVFNMVEACAIGVGTVLVQADDREQMEGIT